MPVPTPPSAAVKPVVHPAVADERLVALVTARHPRRHLAFQRFLAAALKPVEVSE